jgi:WD40 repeat protein
MPAAPGDQQTPRPEEVFISYSRKDKEFVRRLDEELKRRDREAWVDWEGIPPGDTWEKTIYRAIESTHTFIFVLTPDSIASEVCGREIAHAAANNKRLVPIVYRDVADDTVPEALRKLNWIFYRDSDDFEKATDELISALDTDLKWVRAHTRLLTRAIEWDASGRNNSLVLRGEDLRAAERWLAEAGAQKERQPTALQTEYIIASRKASARRQRITLGAVTFGLVVAIVLGVLAEARRREVTRNLSRASFVQAIRLLEDRKSAEALAYLARALRIDPKNRAASVRLFTLLTQRNFALCTPSAVGEEPASEAPPDDLFPGGSRTADGTAQLKQDEKGQWLFSLTTPRVQNKTSFRFAPAGSDPWSPNVSSIFKKDGSLVAICVGLPRASFVGVWNANGELTCETIHVRENIDHVWFDPPTGFLVLHNAHSDQPGHPSSAWNISSRAASFDVFPKGETTRLPTTQKDLLSSRDEENGLAIPHTRLRIRQHPGADDYQAEVCQGSTIMQKLVHDDAVYCFVPSASGRFVATGSGDGTARIWNPKNGKPTTGVLNAGKKIWRVRFSEDEQLLATATGSPSDDETSGVQLWDVVTGLPVSDSYPFEGAVDTVQFTSDNRQLVVEVAAESPTGDPPLLSYTAVLSVSFSTKSAIPEWLPALAETVGGYTVNEAGSLEEMPMDRRTQLLKEIQAQITAPDDDDAKQFGTWFFAQRTTRPIRPFSETDPQQWRNSKAQLHFSEP